MKSRAKRAMPFKAWVTAFAGTTKKKSRPKAALLFGLNGAWYAPYVYFRKKQQMGFFVGWGEA